MLSIFDLKSNIVLVSIQMKQIKNTKFKLQTFIWMNSIILCSLTSIFADPIEVKVSTTVMDKDFCEYFYS